MSSFVIVQRASAGGKGPASPWRATRRLLWPVVCLAVLVVARNLVQHMHLDVRQLGTGSSGAASPAVAPHAAGSTTPTAALPSSSPAAAAEEGAPVAILNQEVFHYEVLAGFLHLASSLLGTGTSNVTTYVESHNWRGNDTSMGFNKLVRPVQASLRELPCPILRHKVLIFISPEYNLSFVQRAIQQAQPLEVLLLVHNGDTPLLHNLMGVHPRTRIITLAPHVRAFLLRRWQGEVKGPLHPALEGGTWMLPIWPWAPWQRCAPTSMHGCLSGFTIQGKINRYKRNYTYVFSQLEHARQQCLLQLECQPNLPHLKLQLLGAAWTSLTIPAPVVPFVKHIPKLWFHSFYQHVYKAYALLPALGGQGAYYDRKFTSTLISSLVTGTPMLVDRDLLRLYPFLSASQVILQQQGHTLADTMMQVMRSSDAQLAATRAQLLALREVMNQDAQAKLREMLAGYPGVFV